LSAASQLAADFFIPDAYRDFHAFSNSIIILHSGNYSFNKFLVEPDVHIVCKIDNVERLNLNIQTELRFADRTTILGWPLAIGMAAGWGIGTFSGVAYDYFSGGKK